MPCWAFNSVTAVAAESYHSVPFTFRYTALHVFYLLCLQMHRVVITRQAPDAMLGLPGCLCVIGSSREKGHETADIPVHVFGPPGTGDYLSTMYEVGWRNHLSS
jgi:hypothetical protein